MENKDNRSGGLRSVFTPLGIWSFSIGTSIGWGSFIVTCNAYLQKSGVLGTIFGLLVGMAVILVITWNLQHMIRKSPDAGGAYTFVKRSSGKDLGFITFWFILLAYMAVLWANITSLPLFSRFFLGDLFKFGFHYSVFGYDVWFGEALLSMCALLVIGELCINSSKLSNFIMIAGALTFTAAFTVCAAVAFFGHDRSFSYSPLYTEGSSAFAQIVRIAAISPWAFIGFENISHFSEEYTFPLKKIRRILICSVVITTLLYIFVSVLSVSAYPPEYSSWLEYIGDMGNLSGTKAVPAFYAAEFYLGRTGVFALMLALFGVIITSLFGNMLALSRLLYAAGREGEAPGRLAALNDNGIPEKAIYAIGAVTFFIPLLGRTAIGWIVDVTTLGATMIYGLVSYAVYKNAVSKEERVERCTGIAGMFLMICFILLLLIPDLLPFDAMETESYVLFIVWSVLGLGYFRLLIRKDHSREYRQRIVVWIILLVLVLFASMMWVSRATENAAKEAVEEILVYHESHDSDDSHGHVKEDRLAFLEEQAEKIGRTNILYTFVSLGLFVLTTGIILHNYRDTKKLGDRLDEAEEAARAAKKIAELTKSIKSLMDNMPGMNFAKDVETGVYLACNMEFVKFSNKTTPDDVIGLTDRDLFDAETAGHYEETDRIALSMDEAFIFEEDVLDAYENRRQLHTTKMKYLDSEGRMCILGMCRDLTDLVRVQTENIKTKEDYERARNKGMIYNSIAQTLVHGYVDMYYVDLDTEEYVEYLSNDENSSLSEEKRGWHFFEKCREDINIYVHPDDREALCKALERKTLLDYLDRNKTFVTMYRLLAENGAGYTYVSMKISKMEDNDHYIIMGVTDADEEMKQRKAAERMKEEHTAYARLTALASDFICVYIVDPETGYYREYSANEGYEYFAIPKKGDDFFESSREKGGKYVYKDDLEHYLSMFTREIFLEEIRRNSLFTFSYRLNIDDKPVYVRLKAAMVEESDGPRMIVGINDIDAYVRQEEDYAQRLAKAQSEANIDALTGVRNRHAFEETEQQLDREIGEHTAPDFAIVVLDVNDLKKVNDTEGHKAGDEFIRSACSVICNIFKRSPVFRVGGDEFAVIARGNDYASIEALVGEVADHNAEAARTGGVVIACGMSKFDNDTSVAPVYERADRNMYENKSFLKSGEVR